MSDPRRERTRQSIKDSLLTLMGRKEFQNITVAEIAREANVSRSTFYSHFSNTHEIFVSLVKDFTQNLQSLPQRLRCNACNDKQPDDLSENIPFCIAVRNEKRMRSIVRNPLFLQALFEVDELSREFFRFNSYEDLGLSEVDAKALYHFQMTGCYMSALSEPNDSDWERVQSLIDTFIQGGRRSLAKLRHS